MPWGEIELTVHKDYVMAGGYMYVWRQTRADQIVGLNKIRLKDYLDGEQCNKRPAPDKDDEIIIVEVDNTEESARAHKKPRQQVTYP